MYSLTVLIPWFPNETSPSCSSKFESQQNLLQISVVGSVFNATNLTCQANCLSKGKGGGRRLSRRETDEVGYQIRPTISKLPEETNLCRNSAAHHQRRAAAGATPAIHPQPRANAWHFTLNGDRNLRALDQRGVHQLCSRFRHLRQQDVAALKCGSHCGNRGNGQPDNCQEPFIE